MPTIIDSLLVTFGLDAKKFKQGQAQINKDLQQTGKEADKTGDKLEGAGKKGAKGFGEASDGLTKFLAKLGGLYALKKFVIDTVQGNAELYRFSRNLGESTNKISAWSNAIEITGGDARAFQGTLSMLSRSQTELQMTGQNGLLPFFSRFNVAMMDANGNARKGADILLDFSDRMRGMDRTTAFNTMQAMGIDPGTANAMLEGRASLERLVATQKEHGALTDKQALNAEKSRRSLTEAQITANALKNEISDGMNPALKNALDLFNSLDRATGGWSTALLGVVASIGALRSALGAAASVVGGGAVAGAGAAAGGGLAARLLGVLGMVRGAIGWGALFHSEDLNAGEGAELEKRRAMGGTFDKVDPRKYFESKGWSPAQAAGIVANLQTESKMNPAAVGDKGAAYGIAQWHPDRQANFAKWAGRDIKGSSLAEQLAFVQYELTQGNEQAAGLALRSSLTPGRAGSIFSRTFERPGDVEGEAARRGALASVMMGIPGATRVASGAGAAPSAGGGAQVTTTIGEIKVYTQATDAPGIARDLGMAINSQFPAQANSGNF